MPKSCINPSEFRKKNGFSKSLIESLGIFRESFQPKELRAIASNIGVDDIRALDMKKGAKHMFGKNIDEITEWNGSTVSKNTLVKEVDEDGYETYFLSKRKTDIQPTKWVVDGRTTRTNPDWDYIGKNQTIDDSGKIKTYEAVNDRIYKESDKSNDVLKVTKLYNSEDGKHPSLYKLAQQNYDGIQLPNGNIKLISASDQAKNPLQVTIPDETSVMDKAVKQSDENVVSEQEITERLKTLGIGKKLAHMTAGYILGSIGDAQFDTENLDTIGMLIGLGYSFPQVKAVVNGFVRGDVDNFEEAGKLIRAKGSSVEEVQEMAIDGGYRGNPLKKENIKEYKDKFFNGFKKAAKNGKSLRRYVMNNQYISSGVTQLSKMGSEKAKELLQTLRGHEVFHTTLIDDFGQEISSHFGSTISIDEFDEIQASVVRDFIDSNPRLKEKFEGKSDQYLKEQLGSAIHRIVTFESEISDGKFVYNKELEAAQQAYKENFARDIDEFILRHNDGSRVVSVIKNTFDRYYKLLQRTYDSAFHDVSGIVTDKYQPLLYEIRDSGLSAQQWKNTIESTEDIPKELEEELEHKLKLHIEALENNKPYREAIEFSDRLTKVEKLEGRYFPQVWDVDKTNVVRKKLGLKDNEAWAQYKINQILSYNDEGYGALQINGAGDDVEVIYGNTFDEILNKLRNDLVGKIQGDVKKRKVLADLDSGDEQRISQYIGKRDIKGKTRYYVKNSDDIDILSDINNDVVGQAQKTFLNMTVLRQSNNLDNPRNYILPQQFIETDIRKVVHRYARDAGNRIYLIRNGVGTDRQLDNKLKAIGTELKKKGVNQDVIQEDLDLARSWYANITRTSDAIEIDMTPERRIARHNRNQRNKKIVSTLMNLGYMPFLWGTSFYSLFQPFITGPFLGKISNVRDEYKAIFTNPQRLKNAAREIRKMGIMRRKISSVSAEMELNGGDELLDGSDASFLDSMHRWTEKGVKFSSEVSFARTPLNKVLNKFDLDYEDTGFLRLFVGNLYEITEAESAITSMAVLRHTEDLVEAGNLLLRAPEDFSGTVPATQVEEFLQRNPESPLAFSPRSAITVELDGTKYRWGNIKRQLEELGITDARRFVEESSRVNDAVDIGDVSNIGAFIHRMSGDLDESEIDMGDYLRREYVKLTDTVVNQLHGRTHLTRPNLWTNNIYGRLLSQFSVYSKNFSVQVKRRTFDPVESWLQKYNTGNHSILKIAWWMKTGQDSKLRQVFGEQFEDAYNDFPVDAFHNFTTVLPFVGGVGLAMEMTRDAYFDAIGVLSSEALGNDNYEAWESVRQNSKWAQDVFGGGKDGFDAAKLMMGGLGHFSRMAFFGRGAQIFLNGSRYNDDGVWSSTPVTGMINSGFNVATKWNRVSLANAPEATARSALEFALLRSPVIGTTSQLRESVVNAVFQKPKNRDVQIIDGETGQAFDDVTTITH